MKDVRLDKFLCKKFDISFALAQKLIREKKVKVNNTRVDGSYKVNESDHIEVFSNLVKRIEKQKTKPKISFEKQKNFFSSIIFEDENLVAINKPSGLATQGGSGIEISVDDFILSKKWQLVHRLDKDTSGILLIAKNSKTADFLTDAFRNKTIKKTYLALVSGIVKKQSGVINIPLRKEFFGKNEKVRPNFEEGKEAITEFKLLKTFVDYSALELNPITGRTHQLRVHTKEIGHPILNDVKYGGKEVLRKDICKRLCLHAYKIELQDYFGKRLEIKTELPEFVK
ncbi:MAG: RluA family pseudouridine synthase [Rickettsiales bacterium]|nr:RluA family pseudouridine synthase [Rickettsiales bacterium]